MKIRPESAADGAGIHALLAKCFPTTVEARLVDQLRAAGRLTVALVAEEDESIIGYVAFSPVTAAGAPDGAGLAPLAVAESHRRKGIGEQLVRRGLNACRAAGFEWAVVLGEPEYYVRFGFRAASECGLSDAYGGGAAFQVLALVDGRVPAGAGRVCYAPEFDGFG